MNQYMRILNESIDQDEKFTREIKALFKTKEVIELLQKAYDQSDENARISLMDATEEQFLNKFAKDGAKDPDGDADGSDEDFEYEKDGSDIEDEPEDNAADADPFAADSGDMSSDPFAGGGDDFGAAPEADTAQPENSNPFESFKPRARRNQRINESHDARRARRALRAHRQHSVNESFVKTFGNFRDDEILDIDI